MGSAGTMNEGGRTVLLVDGDATRASQIEAALVSGGIAVVRSGTRRDALSLLQSAVFDAMVIGSDLPDTNSSALTAELVAGWPDIPIIVAEEADAVDAVIAGATDYLRLTHGPQETLFVINRAMTTGDLVAARPPKARLNDAELTVVSPTMQGVFDTVRRAAPGTATVLIRGESGVGKELVARRLHELSARSGRPFVKVHCAAIPEQILESELFGYEKGAFTGAVARKPGRLDLAAGGTLFLDEIGDISAAVQVKLLRILQDREYERLGGTQTLKADVRFVAATNRNLERMIKKGDFREDLYYRLNVVRIEVPPLRARPEDMDALIGAFARAFAETNNKATQLSADAIALLKRQRWPGNVRQLQNFIERAVVLTDAPVITAAELQVELEREIGAHANADTQSEVSVIALGAAVRQAECRAIQKALKKAGGDRSLAARILGVSRRTLFYKLREHKLG
jgi:DNA-binding NtrC family response regulator